MIRRIRLINFMSHDDTVIYLADGLTVLTGPNNCGKSAVVAALQILCHNGPSNHVIRHNEKECSVTVDTDDGHTIEWRRTKLSPKYIIDGEVFDRLGRSGTPDILHQILRLPKVKVSAGEAFDIHFGEQKSPLFLLDKPTSQAAQFFAASSDAASLIEMQALHRKRIVDSRRKQKELQARSTLLEDEIAGLDPADCIAIDMSQLEAQHAEFALIDAQCRELAFAISAVQCGHRQVDEWQSRASSFEELVATPSMIDTEPIGRLLCELHFAQTQSAQITNECAAVHQLSAPPILDDIEGRRQLVSHITATAVRVDLSQRQFNSMLSLEEPPEIVNYESIERDIVAISFAEQSQLRLETMHVEMSSLVAPPEWIETQDFSRSLRVLEESQSRLDTTLLAAEHCTSEFAQSTENLRAWVAENPICATCGGPMDADRLLDLDRSGEGDHSHG